MLESCSHAEDYSERLPAACVNSKSRVHRKEDLSENDEGDEIYDHS